MSAITLERPVADEQLLYQATVDGEFRTALLDNPNLFGINRESVFLPDAVVPQEHIALEIWNESMALAECASSCSAGVVTIVCDGGTK